MKTFPIVPSILAGFVLCALLLSLRPGEDVERSIAVESRTGMVTGWKLLADGTVMLRLSGTDSDREFVEWFATPSSRTATTEFEQLALEAILAADDKGLQLTVTTDDSNGESGKSPEDAKVIESIHHLD